MDLTPVDNSDMRSSTLAGWIRFLLPFAIGAVGLYVGLIIAPMDTRIRNLEVDTQLCKDYRISDAAVMQDVIRRIGVLEGALNTHRINDHNSFAKIMDVERFRQDIKESLKDLKLLIRDNSTSITNMNRKSQ